LSGGWIVWRNFCGGKDKDRARKRGCASEGKRKTEMIYKAKLNTPGYSIGRVVVKTK
jgi:hypothetical protein